MKDVASVLLLFILACNRQVAFRGDSGASATPVKQQQEQQQQRQQAQGDVNACEQLALKPALSASLHLNCPTIEATKTEAPIPPALVKLEPPPVCPTPFVKTDKSNTFNVTCTPANQSIGLGQDIERICCSVTSSNAMDKFSLSLSEDCGGLKIDSATGSLTGVMTKNSCLTQVTAKNGAQSTSSPVTLFSRFVSLPQGLPDYNGLPAVTISGVRMDAQKNLYLFSNNGLSISKDRGLTFENRTAPDGLVDNAIRAVAFEDEAIYVSSSNGLAKSTNGGKSFFTLMTDVYNGALAVKGQDVFYGYQTLFVSHDGGKKFDSIAGSSGFKGGLISAMSWKGSTLYLATTAGVAMTSDTGKSFRTISATEGLASNAVTSVVANNKFIVVGYGDSGKISISKDEGKTWTTKTLVEQPPVNATIELQLGENENEIYVSVWGNGGGIYISKDGGETFVNRSTADGLGHTTVYGFVVDGKNIYAGTYQGLSISKNGGESFENFKPDKGLNGGYIGALAISANGKIYTGDVNSGLQVSTDSGRSFQTLAHPSLGLSDVSVDNENLYLAFSYGAEGFGGVGVSTDGGKTMKMAKAANGLGSNCVNSVFGKGNTIYASTFVSIYCDGAVGGVSISKDGGETFINRTVENSALASNQTSSVLFALNTLFVGTDLGLSVSTDGGQSFSTKSVSDGLGSDSINVVKVFDGKVYVGTSGGLSISDDGGKKFVTKTTKNGLPVNGVLAVYARGQDVYVGTSYGLAISHDGGETFLNHTVSNGLGGQSIRYIDFDGKYIYAGSSGAGGLSRTR